MICKPTRENLARAASLLMKGDVVAFPTETVYGLGADATNEGAVKKIFEIKGRPNNNPLIVHLPSFSEVQRHLSSLGNNKMVDLVEKLSVFWPGPLTVVVPKLNTISSLVTGGGDSLALRVPKHPIAHTLLEMTGLPIAAPSANLSQKISPTTAEHVLDQLGDRVPMILDGGQTTIGLESTVISLLDPLCPTILRPGAISLESLSITLGITVASITTTGREDSSLAPLASPGLMERHYAPVTTTKFLSSVDLWSLPPIRIGLLAFREGLHLDFDFAAIRTVSANCNLIEVAHNLYSALFELDHSELDLILVDSCDESGLGVAIMDRLRRATAKDW